MEGIPEPWDEGGCAQSCNLLTAFSHKRIGKRSGTVRLNPGGDCVLIEQLATRCLRIDKPDGQNTIPWRMTIRSQESSLANLGYGAPV